MRTDPATVALVVPVYNESANVDRFIDRLLALGAASDDILYRLVFVDDGSCDDSVARIERRLPELRDAQVVQLSRNFGKESALLAGIDAAIAAPCDAVAMIDADLQHPPEALAQLVARWRAGDDVVIASRVSRATDPAMRRFLTRGFYRTINRLSDVAIADGDGDFRLMDRAVADALSRVREQHRFTKGLYAWVGFKTSRVPVEYDMRAGGESSFRAAQLFSLAFNAITSFSAKPLRLALLFGVAIGLTSFALGGWIVVQTFVHGKRLPGYASLFCGMTFLGGIQLIGIGLLGEYVGRTYIESKSRPPYLVRRIIREDAPQ